MVDVGSFGSGHCHHAEIVEWEFFDKPVKTLIHDFRSFAGYEMPVLVVEFFCEIYILGYFFVKKLYYVLISIHVQGFFLRDVIPFLIAFIETSADIVNIF